jgi:hypothetical protein
MAFPVCTCEEEPYPYLCGCLDIMVHSPEMRAVCRNEDLVVDGEKKDHDREKLISMWANLSQIPPPSATGFLKGALKATAAYFNNDPENLPVIQERFDICSACDLHFLGRCKMCGCPIGSKVWEKAGKCPDKRW